jgi:hypothetical protein
MGSRSNPLGWNFSLRYCKAAMDERYKVGEKLGQATAGMGIQEGDPLAELLAGGGDIEQYLQSYEQMLSQGLPTEHPQLNQVDAEGGMLVRPTPGFVVKTRDTVSGMKVFLNITSNEHIEAPHMQSLVDMDNQDGVRVPLSVGTPMEDFDKKNEPCVTYDLVANPETVTECQNTPAFRESVVNLCMAAVAQKYKVELDPRYKLPKMTYKGDNVQLQRIRKKNASKIQEVETSAFFGGTKDAQSGTSGTKDNGLKPPEFCVFYSLPDAGHLDGFSAKWGPLIEDHLNSSSVPHISALDLPIYRINAWKENIRGTMKNLKEKEAEQSEDQNTEVARSRTQELLKGRTCVAQVRMPDLDKHVATLKQFRVEISDECLRISFPPLPKSTKSVYATLSLWWPFPFYSSQAVADWNPEMDMLQVSLPAELPSGVANMDFDPDLLDAVF